MDQRTITIINGGTFRGNISIFQKQPDLEAIGAMSLAWLTKGTNPGTKLEFNWVEDYWFIWSEKNVLEPEVVFSASQTIPANLRTNNKITLEKNKYGYFFTNQVTDTMHTGQLIIEEDNSIPGNEASIGIGMSGIGTLVWSSEPNVDLNIQPKPQYWVCYGTFNQGEILNTQQLVDRAIQIEFPTNKYNAIVTLSSNNTWENIIYN
ncbi:hypothetical protein [Halocella sp. SP3-1]|uniref:hypothetical protein n=1 Tax=Halocella sp. SP3-1 TaxID=2382161 RepID=UPI000F74C280|nr:hypothetical protein [Halocella sp. SP3-1]AZO94613.1 hypothetical protein D7D81_08420 [Halocella sp. SP3-1]